MTLAARLIWEMHCFEICMMAYEINLAKRHTTGAGVGA